MRTCLLGFAAGSMLGLVAQGALAQGPPAPAAPDSAVYVLSPQSVLEVHVGKAGLLSGLGHEHRIRAAAFTGEIVYFPAALGRSHVSITVPTDSLRVVPDADSADIPKITATMRQKTLQVDSFPEITFISREVASADTGAAPGRIRVSGDLTLVGKTRPISEDMDLALAGDTLRAGGSFVVKQTDFGIKPYGTALGMVKVKNAVRLELHVLAVARRLLLRGP